VPSGSAHQECPYHSMEAVFLRYSDGALNHRELLSHVTSNCPGGLVFDLVLSLTIVMREGGTIVNWDVMGSIGEVAGAIGVIVSLVYLAIQIRQNSAWLKSTVIESAGTRTRDLTASVYADAELSRIVSIGFTRDAETLTLEQRQRFGLVMNSGMRGQEINFVHYKSGLLDEDSYEGLLQNMTVWTNSPLFTEWWKVSAPIFRKDFRAKVEEIRNAEKGVTYDPFVVSREDRSGTEASGTAQ
jgi:hypothetical protein